MVEEEEEEEVPGKGGEGVLWSFGLSGAVAEVEEDE